LLPAAVWCLGSGVERDMTMLGKKLGIFGVRFSRHTLRHTFAVTFLRNGGDFYMLSRILCHASITNDNGVPEIDGNRCSVGSLPEVLAIGGGSTWSGVIPLSLLASAVGS